MKKKKTRDEELIERGRHEGFRQAYQEMDRDQTFWMVYRFIEMQLGKLSLRTALRIGRLSVPDLRRLGARSFGFVKKADLHAWLQDHESSNKRRPFPAY